MDNRRTMRLFAKWHIWLAWLVGFPLLMWTVTGLVMVSKPIEEVRGDHLRIEAEPVPLPPDTRIDVSLPAETTRPVLSVTTAVERGETVTRIAYADGTSERFRADGSRLGPLSEIEARMIIAEQVRGGERVTGARLFGADEPPLDFRRPIAVWQVVLADGTHVYVNAQSGTIEAVRTRWWRLFDLMWGLHIMDLEEREDTSHPVLIGFTALAVIGSLLGCVLMFRRRKARPRTPPRTSV